MAFCSLQIQIINSRKCIEIKFVSLKFHLMQTTATGCWHFKAFSLIPDEIELGKNMKMEILKSMDLKMKWKIDATINWIEIFCFDVKKSLSCVSCKCNFSVIFYCKLCFKSNIFFCHCSSIDENQIHKHLFTSRFD